MNRYQVLKNRVATMLLKANIVERHVQERIKSAYPRASSMGKFSENDVFVVGYPKSGNTWMQTIISAICFGVDPKYSIDALTQDLVQDVHSKKYFKRYGLNAFFKSHHLPKPEYRKVIYILRDGRDMFISTFHYLSAISNEKISLRQVISGDPFPEFGLWSEHVMEWLSNPYDAEILLVRYEDLLKQPEEELARIASFCDVDRTAGDLQYIADNSTFNVMKKKEKLYGFDNLNWPKDIDFFRKGISGEYADVFTEEDSKIFWELHGKAMHQAGY